MVPNSIGARATRAVAYYRKGDTDNSIRDHTEVIRLKPNFSASYVDRGAAYAVKHQYDKALSDYNQALRLNPKDARAYCDRADLEDYVLNQPDKALGDYNAAIRYAPKFQRAYFNRAQHFQGERDYQRALTDLTEAIRLMPNDSDAYAARAHAYARLGDRTHAIADANTAIKLGPTTKMYLERSVDFRSRASAYIVVGRYELALRDLREAVRLTPNDTGANGSLAWFLATCPDGHLRNGGEAVTLAKKAHEMSGGERFAFNDTLAAAYAEIGNFHQAAKFQRQSLEDPTLTAKQKETREERLNLYEQQKPFRDDPFQPN